MHSFLIIKKMKKLMKNTFNLRKRKGIKLKMEGNGIMGNERERERESTPTKRVAFL